MNELILDISEWQGVVDMKKVKNAGVYGIIQCIGRGTDQDVKFAYDNVDSALANGLKVGLYWFVYATNVKGARKC